MHRRSIYLWLVVAIFALVLAGCTEPVANQPTPQAEQPGVAPAVPTVEPGVAPDLDTDVRVIEVNAEDFRFSPDNIDVDLGETVRFVLYSVDDIHTFTVKRNMDDADSLFTLEIPAGGTEEVTWTFDEIGEYYFYCELHEADGMWGTITVRD